MRWLARALVAVVLAGVVVPAYAQDSAPLTGGSADTAYRWLAEPCQGVAEVLARQGVSPYSGDRLAQQVRRHAVETIAPLLGELITTPTLADDPDALRARIAQQVTDAFNGRPVFYSPGNVTRVWQQANTAAIEADAVWQAVVVRGEPGRALSEVPSGTWLLWRLASDPVAAARWEEYAQAGARTRGLGPMPSC